MSDPDPTQRKAAIAARVDTPSATPELLARLAVETSATVLDALLDALARRPEPSVLDAFERHIGGEDVALRNLLVQRIQSSAPLARAMVPRLLDHPDPDVRLFGVQIVGGATLAQGPRLLCALLARESQVNVLGAAVDALAELGDDACVPELRALGQRLAHDPFLSFSVDSALAVLEEEAHDGRR